MRVLITGASGLVGSGLTAALLARGVQVSALSRDPARTEEQLGIRAAAWDLMADPAPREALVGQDAVVHLAGENVAQRWTAQAKHRIRASRVTGTRNLLEGLRQTRARQSEALPGVLISASAIGYYGPRGEEPLDEDAPPGQGFLAQTCVAWESEAQAARELGMRAAQIRIGVVMHRDGGALAKMLPPFRLGVGGPIASGNQYVSWIHRDDLVGLIVTAIEQQSWVGPVNATAPEPVTNRELSHALGQALHRPSLLPVPGLALRLLYGEMAEVLTTGARVLPAKALVLGHRFEHPHVREALVSALSR